MTATTLTVPITGPVAGLPVNLAILTQEVNSYKSQLGLDDNSPAFPQMTPANQKKVRKFSGDNQMASIVKAYTAHSTADKVIYFIPLINSIITGYIAFSFTYNFLHECLNELEQVALAFVDQMNANTVRDFDID